MGMQAYFPYACFKTLYDARKRQSSGTEPQKCSSPPLRVRLNYMIIVKSSSRLKSEFDKLFPMDNFSKLLQTVGLTVEIKLSFDLILI